MPRSFAVAVVMTSSTPGGRSFRCFRAGGAVHAATLIHREVGDAAQRVLADEDLVQDDPKAYTSVRAVIASPLDPLGSEVEQRTL
jgi:hypothetical protein